MEASEVEEVGEYQLPEALQGEECLRQAIHNAIEELDQTEQNHLHPSDMEARMMLCEERKVLRLQCPGSGRRGQRAGRGTGCLQQTRVMPTSLPLCSTK